MVAISSDCSLWYASELPITVSVASNAYGCSDGFSFDTAGVGSYFKGHMDLAWYPENTYSFHYSNWESFKDCVYVGSLWDVWILARSQIYP